MVLLVMKKCTAFIFIGSPHFLTLKMKAPHSFEMSDTTHPTTLCRIPEDLNPQEQVKIEVF
jgi:hypothetical protein